MAILLAALIGALVFGSSWWFFVVYRPSAAASPAAKPITAPPSDDAGLLRPRIDALGAGPMSPNTNGLASFASIIVTIINNGAPTSIEDFRLTITLSNGVIVAGTLLTIPEGGVAINYANHMTEILTTAEALDRLALTPVPSGAKLQGRLWFGFNALTHDQLLSAGTIAVLSMKDAVGKHYETPPFAPTNVVGGPDRDFPGLRPIQRTARASSEAWKLNDDEVRVLIERLAPYAKSYDGRDVIMANFGDVDATSLAAQFVRVFRAAGWPLRGSGYGMAVSVPTPIGVVARIHEGDSVPGALQVIADTLRESGFLQAPLVVFQESSIPAGSFELRIGARPR